jgi:UDP-2,4-diacetamido-2,4,6-trideoxy-beta-L-altropyranose hydrolase
MNWERCFLLGLPAIVVVVAANQTETCQALAQAGAIIHLGWHAEVGTAQIAAAVEALVANPSAIRRLSGHALQVMAPDSKPAARIKIIDTLMGTNGDRRQRTG